MKLFHYRLSRVCRVHAELDLVKFTRFELDFLNDSTSQTAVSSITG